MSKIICDICGTSYPDTADQCPICGCSRDFSLDSLLEEPVAEEVVKTAPAKPVKAPVFGKRKRVIEEDDDDDEYEDDEYDEDEYDDDDDDDDDEYEDDDDHKSNGPLVVFLVIVIMALVAVSGFIFGKFFLPNILSKDSTPPTVAQTEALPEETTVVTVPCENLALTSAGDVVLTAEGDHTLINVLALPENTTDKIIYTSGDESIVTVDAQGKVTAVGEGTAVITITCGKQELQCTVTCNFSAEATEPEETEAPEETTAPATEPEETEAPTEETKPLKDIKLKVSLTDLTFNAPNQGYTFKVDGLANTEVKWTSNDEKVVTVDENGTVISVGRGRTTIICEYGDQKVEIKINCAW